MHAIRTDVYWPILKKIKAAKVLVLHNLEEEVLKRQVKIMSFGLKRIFLYHDAVKMHYLEKRLIKNVDLILVTSDRERSQLLKKMKNINVFVAPNGVDCQAIQRVPLSKVKEVLFVD